MTAVRLPPVSAIADVLALWGCDGWLTPPLGVVVASSTPTIATVLTVALRNKAGGPGLAPLYDVVDADLTGQVLVVAASEPGHGVVRGAVWGEILATAAHASGAAGVLVHGSVRDVPALAALGLPVNASGRCVVGPNGTAHVVDVGARVTISGTDVEPADEIVLDETGCVRIRAGEVAEVLDAARQYAAAEERVVDAVRNGVPLAEAYLLKKSAVDELRR